MRNELVSAQTRTGDDEYSYCIGRNSRDLSDFSGKGLLLVGIGIIYGDIDGAGILNAGVCSADRDLDQFNGMR